MTALCEMAVVKDVRIQIKATETISLNLTADLMQIQLFSRSGGLLGTIRELLFAKWNEGELPIEEGQHNDVVFAPNPVQIWYSGRLITSEVYAHMTVGVVRYFGELNDAQAAMIRDDGPEVEMPQMEDWRELQPEDVVAPEITFGGVRSY
ncbi:hypothetical protein [Bryobacter aggregatus]|uniref:hypothetical protein n=1 Tax=Bryobacter aggregatus TaxID=360054 RepID=UPI0012BAACAF|nr:hypothetical protein [Bryobacter aggregatus]